ncbi:hypothetical protein [Flavobacterium sp. LC2016-23]|uniref:hypothetical protein n=1 Tax=Flavobacterium sp. LC2016-23 TaxID=2666330 RepID=UPI0018A1CC5A|nr:hypothetical protein [Flavobacterium sp. LC2016-23]
MKNKTTILIIFFIVFTISSKAQSFTPTPNIANSGAANNFKGGYTFSYATAGTPWNGSLISYGGLSNSYDTQISSDYGPNGGNHISYRTKNGDANTWNPWFELAIRGANTFTGTQIINGNLSIGVTNPLNTFEVKVPTSTGTSSSDGIAIHDGATNRLGINIGINTAGEYSYLQAVKGGIGQKNIAINPIGGNVGIGTTNPTAKLTVAGDIASREVKVTVDAGADFVFENNYNLPSLDTVDQYIKENKHLPEIASADEMKKDGINLSEMNIKLLQKIEELTLYTIEQQKNTEKLTKVIETLTRRLEEVERK